MNNGIIYTNAPVLDNISGKYEDESQLLCDELADYIESNEALIDVWIGETAQYYNLYYLDICKRLQRDCLQMLGSSIVLDNDIQNRMQINDIASENTGG